MPATFEPIRTTTSTATSSITLNDIPQTFTDLVLVCDLIADTGLAFDTWVRFNNDSNSNYSYRSLNGTGSAAQSFSASSQTSLAVDRQATVRTTSRVLQVVNIFNYSSNVLNKTTLIRNAAPNDATEALVGLWRSNAAITSITFSNNTSGNFASGCIFSLYGIRAGA